MDKIIDLTRLSKFLEELKLIFAKSTDIPTNISELENDSGYIGDDNISTTDELKIYLNIVLEEGSEN